MPTLISARDLWRIEPAAGAHRVAIRAGISVLVPLLALVLTGHTTWAPYAAFGAFTSLYGRAHEHLVRFQMQLSAAVMLVAAVVTGVVTSVLTQDEWLLVGTTAVIAATAQIAARAHRYHPPGPLFFVFAYGAISSAPHTLADVGTAGAVAAATAGFALLVGVAGAFRRPSRVREHWERAYLLRIVYVPSLLPVWMALGVGASGALAATFHIGHPYWAMVSAVAPLSAPHVTSQIVRGIHRALGTLGGLVTSWLVLSMPLGTAGLVVAGALLQVAAELLVGRNYGIALLTITPLALVMGQIAAPRPVGELLYDRGVETVIGSLVGIGLALVLHVVRERRTTTAA